MQPDTLKGHTDPRGTTLDDAVVFARALREAGADYVTPSAGNGAPDVRFPPIVRSVSLVVMLFLWGVGLAPVWP